MSAEESLSPKQFVKLYRGLNSDTPDLSNLGIHWTRSKTAAKHFAVMESRQGYVGRGHVIEGHVARDNIVQVNSPEWHELSDIHSIMHPSDNPFEREVTVRRGSPVSVVGVHKTTAKNGRLYQTPSNVQEKGKA